MFQNTTDKAVRYKRPSDIKLSRHSVTPVPSVAPIMDGRTLMIQLVMCLCPHGGQAAKFAQEDSAGDKDALYLCPSPPVHTNSQHTVNSK